MLKATLLVIVAPAATSTVTPLPTREVWPFGAVRISDRVKRTEAVVVFRSVAWKVACWPGRTVSAEVRRTAAWTAGAMSPSSVSASRSKRFVSSRLAASTARTTTK